MKVDDLTWNLLAGRATPYGFNTILPIFGVYLLHISITGVFLQNEEILVFSEGKLSAGDGREDPDRPRKWPQVGILVPGAQVFSMVVPTQDEFEEEEFGDLTSPEVGTSGDFSKTAREAQLPLKLKN